MAEAIQLNDDELNRFGVVMTKNFEDYKKDRKGLEDKWLANLRQYKGHYDPDVQIPKGRSRAYPKITRVKVGGTVSRLMEMLFPQTEKNWGLEPSPIPTLKKEDLQALLDEYQNSAKEAAAGEDAEIEKRIVEFAKEKSARMSTTIDDQLTEQEYVTMVKAVVFSGVLFGVGRMCGPYIKEEQVARWRRNTITGKFEAYTEKKMRPFLEVGNIWNWYPDLAAKSFEQMDGYFEREVHSRAQVRELAERPDYMKERVLKWLKDTPTGNHKELHWEMELRQRSPDRQNVTDISGRKYESIKWWGWVPGKVLQAAGVDMAGKDVDELYEANVHIFGNVVVKCIINPYSKPRRPEHVFVYNEDDGTLTGEGLPETIRDSQMAIANASRMALDNASIVCGPNVLARLSRLADGQSYDIHAFKVWLEDPNAPESSAKPVENVSFDSHISELLKIIELFLQFADTETALPPPAMGDVTQGGSEALRTRGNASMFLGAAALPIRDIVRNFDRFTRSVISSLYDWNMEFNTDATIKGDYNVIPRGSTSLIAKEVRAAALDYLSQTIRPQEEPHVNDRKLLIERMKVRDVDIASVLETEDDANRKIQERAQAAAQDQQQQQMLLSAQVRDLLASAMKKAAEARKADVGTDVGAFETLMKGLVDAIGVDQGASAGAGSNAASNAQ